MSLSTASAALRVALRSLVRSSSYASTAIATIALGIAANVIVFSVADAVLLRPLPYPGADALYFLTAQHTAPDGSTGDFFLTDLEFLRFRERATTVDVGALLTQPAALTGTGEPQTITVSQASANLFSILGVPPERGRAFSASEDVPGGHTIVVSHGFWVSHLGARPSAIGETVEIGGEPYAVVGVMPPGFAPLTVHADAWVPIGIDESHLRQPLTARVITVAARARNGATKGRIDRELGALSDAVTKERPDIHTGWRAHSISLRDNFVGNSRSTIRALVLLVSFLMFLVCANVANLTLAKMTARRNDSSLRAALGADAMQLLHPALAETAVICVLAGAIGLGIAAITLAPLASLDQGATPLLDGAKLDYRGIGFAIAVMLGSALVSVALPAASVVRDSAADELVGVSRRSSGTRRDRIIGRSLMTIQIALALVLAIGATATVRMLRTLAKVPTGFHEEGLTVATLTLPPDRYSTNHARALFAEQLLDRVRATPGITMATLSAHPFQAGASRATSLRIPGRTAGDNDQFVANFRRISGDYLSTMRIPLVAGRAIDVNDREGAVPVAVVSATFAARTWPGEDAIGKQLLRTAPGAVPMTVVGVAADVHDAGLGTDVSSMLYVPYAQLTATNPSSITVVVRSSLGNAALNSALAGAIHAVDRLLPVESAGPLSERVAESLAAQRFRALLLSIFAALGLILAAVGVFGVTSYTVAARTGEVAIRLALGSRRVDIFRLFMSEALTWIVAGVLVGLASTGALLGLLRASLDSGVAISTGLCMAVASLVVVIAAIATLLPVVRATHIAPADVLRT